MPPLFWVVMCLAIIWAFVTTGKKREREKIDKEEQLAVCLSSDFLKMQELWVIQCAFTWGKK